MKLHRLLAFVVATGAMAEQVQPDDTYDNYDDGEFAIVERALADSFEKRDGLLGAVESIVASVYQSQLIPKVLSQVANSESTLDTIAQVAIQGINTGLEAYNALGGNLTMLASSLPVNVNITELLSLVESSGIITSVGAGLLYNDTNRNEISDFLGSQLETHTWVPTLLNGLSAGKDLTWNYLAYTVRNSPSKANETRKDVVLDARDTPSASNNYSGSAQEFFQNLVGTVILSQLVLDSLNSTLVGVANSPYLAPIILDVMQDENLATIVSTVSSKVFESGAVYQIDLSGLYSSAKKKGILVTGLQALLTNPYLEPPLAQIFKRMEDRGVYATVQNNLYGTKK